MTFNTDSFVLGKPRFNDSSLGKTLAAEGVEAAWHKAFQRFGNKAPENVSGDFSVALRASNGTVFLAVDRFAIRTLCYRQVGDTLQFAERADELADASTEIDTQAIFDYLYFHSIPSPRTIYKGIYRVPPAHNVLFENGQLTVGNAQTHPLAPVIVGSVSGFLVVGLFDSLIDVPRLAALFYFLLILGLTIRMPAQKQPPRQMKHPDISMHGA